MLLAIRPGADEARRRQVVEDWFREQVRRAADELIAVWEPKLDVRVARLFIQRMKPRWGSCDSKACTVRLNSELAKKPRECLKYLLVHEMLHILEPTHNERFLPLMSHCMPDWKRRRQVLNRSPVRHEAWIFWWTSGYRGKSRSYTIL